MTKAGNGSASWRRLALADVSSTNIVAMEAARSGDPGDLWVTAERQLQGRGRQGRPWVSEAGNLYASWLGLDPADRAALGKLPFVAALALRNAVAAFVDRSTEVSVKWPNDILVGGSKCVGILLESERLSSGPTAVVVGCGVNIANRPKDAPYPVTSLSEEGYRGGVEPVFAAVAGELARQLMVFDRGRGFAEIRSAWLSHAVGVGMACTVRLPGETIEGIFSALDDEGRLLLTLANGTCRPISAGDVFFSGAPDGARADATPPRGASDRM